MTTPVDLVAGAIGRSVHKEALQDNMTHKSKLLIFLAVFCLALTAFAAGSRITLDSSKEMQPQIDEFKEWYSKLSVPEQAQWDETFIELANQEAYQLASLTTNYSGNVVYVTPNGGVYHLDPNCRHIRNKDNTITLDASQVPDRQYKKPCSTCGK